MAKNVTEKMIDQLNELKISKLIGSGSKRTIAAVVRKLQNGERWTGKAVAQLLDSAADRISIDQDRQAVMDLAAELAGNVPQAVQNGFTGKEAPTPTQTKGRGRKTRVRASQDAETNVVTVQVADDAPGALYSDLVALLDANDIGSIVKVGDDSFATLAFSTGGWNYEVEVTDDGAWTINYQFSDDGDWTGYVADNEAEATDWLINDLELRLTAKKVTTARKARKTAKPKTDNSVMVRQMVSSSLVTITSVAQRALEMVDAFDNDLSPEALTALKELKAASDTLRKAVDITSKAK